MEQLAYLLPRIPNQTERQHFYCLPKIEIAWFYWQGRRVSLHFVPTAWMQPGKEAFLCRKLTAYVETIEKEGQSLWTAPDLSGCFAKRRQPFPDPGLAAFILRQQPFRQILIWRRDDRKISGKEWWQERFLESCFRDLNGLYLLEQGAGMPGAREQAFFDWIYEQSGLPAVLTDRMPPVDGRAAVLVDSAPKPWKNLAELPEGCLYLDLTSTEEKQRRLAEKRTDISYISARNYLDTALKARYNAI